MNNPNPRLTKFVALALPIGAAIILAAIVTLALGLWALPADTASQLGNLVNKIHPLTPTPLPNLKISLPYGYKSAPQTYAGRVEAVSIKTDLANPNTNENLTRNIEVRVYKFTKLTAPSGDLSKGAVFDEATLRKVWSKEVGTYELDLYPVFSKEFKGTTFGPNETKTIAVEFTPTDSGYYAVIFAEGAYFESNTGEKGLGFIRVISGGQINGGAASTTKGGLALKQGSASAAPQNLPATGGEANILTALAAVVAALGLKLKTLVKKTK